MTLRVVAFVTGVVGCTIAVAAKPAVATAGVIKGQVVDEANGQPVFGVWVK